MMENDEKKAIASMLLIVIALAVISYSGITGLFVFEGRLSTANNPVVSDIVLNATNANRTAGNLTVFTEQDSNTSLKLIYNWYNNESLLIVVNIPFENNTVNPSTSSKDYANNQNATITNAFFNATGGYDNKGAYEFDGDGDWMEIPETLDVQADTSWSIEMRFKLKQLPSNLPAGQDDMFLFQYTDAGASADSYLYIDDDNNLKAFTSFEGGRKVDTGTTIALNTLYHVVAVRDGTFSYKIYVDGVLNVSDTNFNFITTGSSYEIFKQDGRAWGNGTVDELRIWNISLTPEQVKALYENNTDLMVSQETNVGDIWQSCVFASSNTSDTDLGCSNEFVIWQTGNGANATYTNFNGNTTDFDNHLSFDAIPGATLEVENKGKIVWNNIVNATNQDFDANVNISANFVSVNSSGLHSSFNSSANITLYNLSFIQPVIQVNDNGGFVTCTGTTTPSCTILSYSSGILVFNTSHFTSFMAVENISLLTAEKTSSPPVLANGSLLNYTINITNGNSGTAFNITLVEDYPANTSFVSSSPAANVSNSTWLLGDLAIGDSLIVTITVQATNEGILNNTINITYDNGTATLSVLETEQTSVCIDLDLDGYNRTGGLCGAVDCNDGSSSTNPGAAEVCGDAIDNNCNGNIDEGCGGGGGGEPEPEPEPEEPPAIEPEEGEDLTPSQVNEIRRSTSVGRKRGSGITLGQSMISISLTNTGNKSIKNISIIVEKPPVDERPTLLHVYRIWGWDLLKVIGWIALSYVEEPALLEWEIPEVQEFDILKPGETLDIDLEVRPPLTRERFVELKFDIRSFGKSIFEQSVPFEINTTELLVIADVHETEPVSDIYLVITYLGE